MLLIVFVPEDNATLLAAVLVVVVVVVEVLVEAAVESEAMDSGGRGSFADTGTGPAAEGDVAHREGVERGVGNTALEGGVGALFGRAVMLPGWR